MTTRPESWPIPPFPEKPAGVTRDQAAEALYRAARDTASYWLDADRVSPAFGKTVRTLRAALDAYATAPATPSPLPA